MSEQQTPDMMKALAVGLGKMLGEPTPPATPQPETPHGVCECGAPLADAGPIGLYCTLGWKCPLLTMDPPKLSPPPDVERLTADDVEWVVNDLAELGVKIGNQFFFCYKGHSLIYDDGTHDDGRPMMWRPIFKREFGECVHPINYRDFTKIGTVSLNDSDEWKPLSSTPGEPT